MPDIGCLLAQIPTSLPGLNDFLDAIGAALDEMGDVMGDLKADLAANIGSMKADLDALIDGITDGIKSAAGALDIPDLELPDAMKDLSKLLATGSADVAALLKTLTGGFPSFDLSGAMGDLLACKEGYDMEAAIPNLQIIGGKVVEKSQPTEAPTEDAKEPAKPPDSPTPAVAKNSLGLAALTEAHVAKFKAAWKKDLPKLIQAVEEAKIEAREVIRKKYFSVVQAPKVASVHVLDDDPSLVSKSKDWPGPAAGAAVERETRAARNLIAMTMARNAVAEKALAVKDGAIYARWKSVVNEGIKSGDYSEVPIEGVEYTYPDEEG